MMRKVVALIVVCASSAIALCAEKDAVTVGEVKDTFYKVEKAFQDITRHPANTAKPDTSSAKNATREEILSEMERVYEKNKPYFKFMPAPIKYDSTVFTIKSAPYRQILERMVKLGFVGKVSMLATAGDDSMPLQDFGDAVGLFVARIAHLTHMPDPKYSPYLQPGGND